MADSNPYKYPHAFSQLGSIILCTKCGRTPEQVTSSPQNRQLCQAPDIQAPQQAQPSNLAPAAAPRSNTEERKVEVGDEASVAAAPAVAGPSITFNDAAKHIRQGVAVLVQFADFELKPKSTGFSPTKWKVTPNFPSGIQISEADGTISGRALDSGGRHQEISHFTITASTADNQTTASCNLVLHFVETGLRSNMGECVACGSDIQDELNARAAACPTKTDEKPHGVHAYCNECFNAMIESLQADAIPLVCTACRDPSKPQQATVVFEDQQIMLALSDRARVRYVQLVKTKQPPGTVRVACNQRGCSWSCDFPEAKLEDLVHCGRAACRKVSCRKCEQEVKMEGQDAARGYVAAMTASEARAMNDRNDLVLQTHLVSCALELRIDEICTRGLSVPCPECGIRSQKDDACTHMVCSNPKCGTRYCYFCGKSRLNCDGAGQNSWSNHNSDWQTNPSRCPMYLEWLSQDGIGDQSAAALGSARGSAREPGGSGNAADADNRRWPSRANDALRLFHQERILRELQKVVRFADRRNAENLLLAAMGGMTYDKVIHFRERPYFAQQTLPSL